MQPRCSATRRGCRRLFGSGWRAASPALRMWADPSGISRCAMPPATAPPRPASRSPGRSSPWWRTRSWTWAIHRSCESTPGRRHGSWWHANWNTSPITSRCGSFIARATISPRRKRSYAPPRRRRTRRACDWRDTPPSRLGRKSPRPPAPATPFHPVEDEPVDEEFLALARERHILYCPTLFVRMGYFYALSGTWQATEAERRLADPQVLAGLRLDEVPRDKLPERVAKLVSEHREVAAPTVAMQNLLKVWNAGITVVMGTDAGNIGTLHGPGVFREMELMQRAGLTPLQVLRSATVNGAATMALSDLGSVAAGKLADLVVLDADPLVDVANLSHASFVFRNGHEFTPAELMSSLH